jgi:hypothetical protein
MKDTKDMNLEELADKVFNLEYCVNGCVREISDRLRAIHDLTRWIPVEERMPTEEDGDSRGLVSVWHDTGTYQGHGDVAHWNWIPVNDEGVTHWQRITPPEGE